MEQRLYEQKITFDRIFDQSPVGIGVSFNSFPTNDELNPYFKVNPSFEKILGYSKEEVRKLGWAYITHPEDLERTLNYSPNCKRVKSIIIPLKSDLSNRTRVLYGFI
jgi:PAS domain S-box-containing protein